MSTLVAVAAWVLHPLGQEQERAETFITTKVTNAKAESANVAIESTKPTGGPYRSHTNYTYQVLLYQTARMAACLPTNRAATRGKSKTRFTG